MRSQIATTTMRRAVVLWSFLLAASCSGWLLPQPRSSRLAALAMGRKKGGLGDIVDNDSAVAKPSRRKTAVAKSTGQSGNVSPALADWMQKKQAVESTSSDSNDAASTSTPSFDDTVEYSSFKSTAATTASTATATTTATTATTRQSSRNEAALEAAIERFKQAIDKKGNLQEIVASVQTLLQQESGALTPVTASNNAFRLAWVGSDEAVCHLCTGLHKVPLARLQEVFMTCNKSKVQIQEVISILGPFPNVKNVLQGTSKIGSRSEMGVTQWTIVWDSMVDGTGKEVLAGKAENTRIVNLQVYLADARVLVGVVPPNEQQPAVLREDPLEDNGKHVLVFLREDDLDEKLELMRVA
jgi:hypothetical protein